MTPPESKLPNSSELHRQLQSFFYSVLHCSVAVSTICQLQWLEGYHFR